MHTDISIPKPITDEECHLIATPPAVSPPVQPPVEAENRSGFQGETDAAQLMERLNSYLRGEVSAVETYRMVIEKFSMESNSSIPDISRLRQIQVEHTRTAQALRDRIGELGGTAAESAGLRGGWAKFTMEVAKMFGHVTALKMLKEAEEHGMKDLQKGIEEIDGTTAHLVQNQFIPAQQRHIDVLEALIATASA